MVKLRLKRMGAKKAPAYRIVATDAKTRRDGREIEVIGTYIPTKDPAILNIDEEKALKWLNEGAAASDTVKSLLASKGIMSKFAASKKSK